MYYYCYFMYSYCFVCSVLCILFLSVVLCIVFWGKGVLFYCHRMLTQLHLTNIYNVSYHVVYHIVYHIILYHIIRLRERSSLSAFQSMNTQKIR